MLLELLKQLSLTLGDNPTLFRKHLDAVTSQFGLQQLIKKPTHILGNSSSCIDLIFISHPSLVMECGIHPSLHSNCHHEIIYAKFNLKIPYEREIWHYRKANTNQIKTGIERFSWDKSFKNLEVDEMVFLFNRNIKNIFWNFIPYELIICDDRDPPWINNRFKELINEKNDICECYLHSNKDPKWFNKVEFLQNELNSLIEANKDFGSDDITKIIHNLFRSKQGSWSSYDQYLHG